MSRRYRIAREGEKGFTLIELLVVIIILGILSAVAVFAVRGTGDKGAAAADVIDRRTIQTAEEAHCAKFGTFASEGLLVANRLLSEESTNHDVTVSSAPGRCGNTTYTITRAPLPPEEQNLTVGTAGDPWRTSKIRLSRFSLDAGTCETMTKLRNDYTVGESLATSWDLISPGNHPSYGSNPTWRFHLRPNVTFHNGVPFTSAAIKYTYDRLVSKNDDFSAQFAKGNNPSSMVIVDDLTIDITPAIPNFRLPEILVHPTYGIMAPGSEPSVNNDVQCTGPFKLKEYVQDARMVVERFDGYWGPKAKLKTLTFKFISDSTTRRLALETGDVDAIFDVGRQQVAGLRANPKLKVVTAQPSAVFLFYQNINGTAPYDKLRSEKVRRALALSIDRQAFIDQNYEPGTASVVQTPAPPSILGSYASTITGYTHNLAQARQLLADDSWVCTGSSQPACNANEIRQKGGVPLNLQLLSNTSDDLPLLQDLKARALAVGINIVIGTDGTNRSTRKNGGQWDLDTSTPNQNDANPAFLLTLQWWSGSINPWISWQQAGPTFDARYAQAMASPTADGARNFAAQAMDYLIDEQAITIPLAGISRVYGLKVAIEGFNPHPAQSHVGWAQVYRTR